MKKSRVFIVILMLAPCFLSFGQVKDANAKRHPVFADGIYLNFNQVKENNPVPKSRIVSAIAEDDKDFFNNMLAGKSIRFYDSAGSLNTIKKNTLWGYSSTGVLYIQYDGIFNPVNFPGRISHFLADVTNADSTNYLTADPDYYRQYGNYGYPRSYDRYDRYYNRNYQPFANGREQLPGQEKRIFLQLLLDFDSGNILEYNVENLKILLQKDADLYNEYRKLSPGRKRKMMSFYINRFNERNPLELPSPKLK